MKKLYLIRHGRQKSRLCNVDVGLDERGCRQASLVGRRLAGAGIEATYCSDLLRAFQTAQTANVWWHSRIIVRPEIREIDFGDLTGLSDSQIAERFAGFQAEQKKMETDIAYPGGECAADVVARSLPVFEEIKKSGYETVAMVTHGGVIRSMMARYLGMDLAKWRLLGENLENCSITELTYDEAYDRFTVERFNDRAHLEQYPELLRENWGAEK